MSPAESPREPTGHPADSDPIIGRAGIDAFISYRRIHDDATFVDHLQQALAEQGKQVWIDQAKIEPASNWSDRIARGIEGAKAFIFVLTPESVVSGECLRELDMATQRHKLIIPLVLRDVDRHQVVPEALSRLNWIFFSPGHDTEHALGELIQALDEDLDWRDVHARLAVRAKEWADSQRDGSFLLRGSDLRSAREWLGQADLHQKTPPTALQAEYILASRKASVRTKGAWLSALGAGLAVVAAAFKERSDAQTQARRRLDAERRAREEREWAERKKKKKK